MRSSDVAPECVRLRVALFVHRRTSFPAAASLRVHLMPDRASLVPAVFAACVPAARHWLCTSCQHRAAPSFGYRYPKNPLILVSPCSTDAPPFDFGSAPRGHHLASPCSTDAPPFVRRSPPLRLHLASPLAAGPLGLYARKDAGDASRRPMRRLPPPHAAPPAASKNQTVASTALRRTR